MKFLISLCWNFHEIFLLKFNCRINATILNVEISHFLFLNPGFQKLSRTFFENLILVLKVQLMLTNLAEDRILFGVKDFELIRA